MPIENLEDSLIADNLKGIAGSPSTGKVVHTDGQMRLQEFLLANLYEGASERTKIMNKQLQSGFALSDAISAAAVKKLLEVDSQEAAAEREVMKDLASRALDMNTVAATSQQAIKAAQSTGPETAVPFATEAIRGIVVSEMGSMRASLASEFRAIGAQIVSAIAAMHQGGGGGGGAAGV